MSDTFTSCPGPFPAHLSIWIVCVSPVLCQVVLSGQVLCLVSAFQRSIVRKTVKGLVWDFIAVCTKPCLVSPLSPPSLNYIADIFFLFFLAISEKHWQNNLPIDGARHPRASVYAPLRPGSARYISSYLSQLTCVLRLTGQR